MWFKAVYHLAYKLSIWALLSLFILSSGRLWMFIKYTNEISEDRARQVFNMFWFGFRYDLRIVAIIYAAFLTVGFIFATRISWLSVYEKTIKYLSSVLFGFFTLIILSNYYYYGTYDRHFDVFVFGLWDEDTKAVLASMWDGYPVIPVVLVSVFSGFIAFKFQNRVKSFSYQPIKSPAQLGWCKKTIGILLLLVIVFISARGSVGTFPLRRGDSQISDLKVLNMLTPNGVIALQWAMKDYYSSQKYPSVTNSQGESLLSRFYGKEVSTSKPIQQLITKTQKNIWLEKNKPNVVFAVMESMSSHLISLDKEEDRDLLGSFRPYWSEGLLFNRFISEGNGTIDSLARFLVKSPVSDISQSMKQDSDFVSNIVNPYKKNGYKVIFVTSGNAAWRNIGTFLTHLGFDEVIDQSYLQKKYPNAISRTWGIDDEFAFLYIKDRLQSTNKPLFIVLLSTTNHPPYVVPESYVKKDFQLSNEEVQRFSKIGNLKEALHTFSYVNNLIGDFITWIKDNPKSTNTIFAVTGDHNVRGIGYPRSEELALGHAVPFYIYIPDEYMNGRTYNPNRVGSHKDILPTLYNSSLSDTEYFSMGCDLLGAQQNEWCGFGYNTDVSITPDGAYSLVNGKYEFYPWDNEASLMLSKARSMTKEQEKNATHIDVYSRLLNWQLFWQVQN